MAGAGQGSKTTKTTTRARVVVDIRPSPNRRSARRRRCPGPRGPGRSRRRAPPVSIKKQESREIVAPCDEHFPMAELGREHSRELHLIITCHITTKLSGADGAPGKAAHAYQRSLQRFVMSGVMVDALNHSSLRIPLYSPVQVEPLFSANFSLYAICRPKPFKNRFFASTRVAAAATDCDCLRVVPRRKMVQMLNCCPIPTPYVRSRCSHLFVAVYARSIPFPYQLDFILWQSVSIAQSNSPAFLREHQNDLAVLVGA